MIRTETGIRDSPPAPTTRASIGNGRAKVFGLLQRFSQAPATRLLVLVLLLTTSALWEARHISAFSSDEIWCHLRTGTWILQNHAIPRTGLFSQFANSRWVDFSWLYDALCGAVYARLGLRAVPLLLLMFKVALAAVTFLVAGGRRRFWWAVILSALAQFAFLNPQPLPNLFSICFFGLTLHWVLEARRRNDLTHLLWLPPLFCLWANLDAQFVLGLLLLSMLLLAEITERTLCLLRTRNDDPRQIPLINLVAIAAACVVATIITPYSFHLIPAALQSAYSPALFKNFAFMAAMSFRQPEHFVLALLLFGACLALGQRRSHDIFKIILLTLSAALAFRIQRDSWTVVLSSIAIIGEAIRAHGDKSSAAGQRTLGKERRYVAAGIAILLTVSFILIPANQTLETRLERVFPARACDYIQNNHLAGPIFNEYGWGGYLMWRLPEYPVSIDERLMLYGDEFSGAYFEVIMGRQKMETLPGFASEQIILLPVKFSMVKALTTIPVLQQQFREVYRDDIAIVLVRR